MYKLIGADLKEYGPVSADQLRLWMAEGRVNGQTKVQAVDSTEWKTIAEIPEFAAMLPRAHLPPSAPVIPITPLPAQPGTSQMAVWAMVLGILSVICCCLLGPVAIILGAVALSQIKARPELTGRGFAITGIVLGSVSILLVIAGIILLILSPEIMQNLQNQIPH